ncbi:unnamed protein product [Fraxinus pennsylvanica]|uniref:PHD finger protein ALFIN-LIKE n=1 Tax=Fraxinus pennsylvanica TaxID=56036 RepID=A0AAD2A7Y1_9LAMI|nr:unnamed protein product [Fraxinus pennsylvanica]
MKSRDDSQIITIPTPRCLPSLVREFKDRRTGIIKALTTGIGPLRLYGLRNGTWEVKPPVGRAPPEFPEPVLGINLLRDQRQEKDWLSYIAVCSDAWLVSIVLYSAVYCGHKKESRETLFDDINDLPTVLEVVTEAIQAKELAAADNNRRFSQRIDEILQEEPIVMGNEIIPYVQVQSPNPIIVEDEIFEQEDPIIMGNEIIPYDQIQPPNPVIMVAEITQQVQVEYEDPDHWRIKKVLKKSDVDCSSRLLIGRNPVLTHIAPFFTNDPSEFCQNNEGLRVRVFDVNTSTEHMLMLKKWKTNSFVLLGKWKTNFVNRRKLEENDEVGLRWDVNSSRLEFAVLRRHQHEE